MILMVKPTITVDCFTNRADVLQTTPIERTAKHIPDWWKGIPNYGVENHYPYPTLKKCSGFLDLFSEGVILQMWADLMVHVGSIGSGTHAYKFADDNRSVCIKHNADQRGLFMPDRDYLHLKLISPWKIKSPKVNKWIFTPCTWHFNCVPDFVIPNGILDFKHQADTNINILFKRKETPYAITMPFNQPIVQIIPLKNCKLKVKTHLVSDREFERIGVSSLKFYNAYKAWKKAVDAVKSN